MALIPKLELDAEVDGGETVREALVHSIESAHELLEINILSDMGSNFLTIKLVPDTDSMKRIEDSIMGRPFRKVPSGVWYA